MLNNTFFKDVILYARSCQAGKELGPLLIQSGLRTFLGYERDFYFFYTKEYIGKPSSDPLAGLFLEPSNLAITTVLKGNTVGDAHKRSVQSMRKNLQMMLGSNATFEMRVDLGGRRII